MERLGKNIPYYVIKIPGGGKKCGDDCFNYLSDHFDMSWNQKNLTEERKTTREKFKSRECTDEDLGIKNDTKAK